jgi:hypothetical protein
MRKDCCSSRSVRRGEVLEIPSQWKKNLNRKSGRGHPSYCEKCKIEGSCPGWSGEKARSYLQNNQSKKSHRHGSSGKLSA